MVCVAGDGAVQITVPESVLIDGLKEPLVLGEEVHATLGVHFNGGEVQTKVTETWLPAATGLPVDALETVNTAEEQAMKRKSANTRQTDRIMWELISQDQGLGSSRRAFYMCGI